MRLLSSLAYGLAFSFLIAIAIVFNVYDIPPALLLRDAAATSNRSPFLGLGSNLGAFCLLSASSIAIFSALLLKDKRHFSKLLLWSGLFSLLLFMDDFFMLHEQSFFVGVREQIIFAFYGVLFISISMAMIRSSINFDFRNLLASALFFTLSILVDVIQSFWDSPWRIYYEDGFKFIGIVSWSIFLIQTAYLAIETYHETVPKVLNRHLVG
jgi:hypothetical protein